MKVSDTVAGALLALVAGWVLLQARAFPDIPGQKIGAGAFPGLVAALLGACALLLLARGLRARAPAFVPGQWVRSPRHVARFALVPAMLLAYVMLSESVGFPLMGFALVAVLLIGFGVRLSRALPIAAGTTLVVFLVFSKLLKVPLPWGVLRPLVLGS